MIVSWSAAADRGRSSRHRRLSRALALAAALAAILAGALPALAAADPVWQVGSYLQTRFAPGESGTLSVAIENAGTDPTDGTASLDITLPAGMTAISLGFQTPGPTSPALPFSGTWTCDDPVLGLSTVHCDLASVLNPGDKAEYVYVKVAVDSGVSGTQTATFDVSGDDLAADASFDDSLTVSAAANFGITSFDGSVVDDQAGNVSFTQAGGHPFAVSTSIGINTRTDAAFGAYWPDEPLKDVFVNVPPGLIGNPSVVAQCTLDELVGSPETSEANTCPPAAQVGVATITFPGCFFFPSDPCAPFTSGLVPVYSLVAPPDVPARFGFILAGTVVTLDAELRSGTDYGLSVNAKNASEGLPIIGTTLTLWGVPADDVHTPERTCPTNGNPTGCPAGVPPRAFLTLPTSCKGPVQTNLLVDSWFHPGVFKSANFTTHRTAAEGGAPQGTTDCDVLPFDATFEAKPDTAISPGASGWSFDLRIPQTAEDDPEGLIDPSHYIDDPDGIAQAHLKKATVTLPEGVRVSPSAADGLQACSPAQINLHSTAKPTCPDASKVGTITIDTPLIDEQLTGSVFLAKPHDNPSGSLLALYLVAEGPGLIVKLPGGVSPNGTSGQLAATFDNNPELPFSHLHLHFFGGPRASISNPARCGTYTTKAVLTSWSGKTVTSNSSFTTSHDGKGAACPAPRFKPEFSAGTQTASGAVPAGGSFSQFVLNLSRSDDDEEFAAIRSVDLPDGLLAKISSVPLCPGAQVAAGTCGEKSRIGSVTTSAGPGANPFTIRGGRVYLGGAYKGAPFSLSIVVPAIAGPFDLGNVVVRAAIKVNQTNAKVSIDSDPLPTVLQGIPLQVRFINVTVDRKKFFVNPTSCNPKRIGATVVSTQGSVANVSSRFQVTDCAALPFSPKLRLTVGGKGHTGSGKKTPLRTTLTMPRGGANLKAVSVTLPNTLNSHLEVVNRACTRKAFDEGHCGNGSRAGFASARTPLLSKPLRGAAYFVQLPEGQKGLPNLIIALRGQVSFNLIGKVKIPQGKLLGTHFTTVPDVPVTKFTLRLVAGRNGAIGNVENLCSAHAKRQLAKLAFRAQNGKLVQVNQPLKVRGCKHRRR